MLGWARNSKSDLSAGSTLSIGMGECEVVSCLQLFYRNIYDICRTPGVIVLSMGLSARHNNLGSGVATSLDWAQG
jgi:hypothetical protein